MSEKKDDNILLWMLGGLAVPIFPPIVPIGLAAWAVYTAGKPVLKGIARGAKVMGTLAKDRLRRRRERIAAGLAEARWLERERQAERNKPVPKTRAQLYRELKAEMDREIEAALVFGEDDEEREAIREIIREKFRDRLARI